MAVELVGLLALPADIRTGVPILNRQMPNIARRETKGFWPEIAFHHYVLARVAMRCGYWYPAADNARLAVELLLKYLLILPQPWNRATWPSRGTVFKSVPRTHELVRLWKQLTVAHPDHQLGEFQQLVEELDRWRDVRYAALLYPGATSFTPTLEGAARARAANAERPPGVGAFEAFAVDIDALDRFVRAVFDYCNITPALRGSKFMVNDGREYYEADNDSAIK
jgi:HEPN domain-containing protein